MENEQSATPTSTSSDAWSGLFKHQYARLTTYRKNGVGVPTTVWFARNGENIYILTLASAGKLKRIRNNGRASLAPCKSNGDLLGPTVDGVARILSPAEQNVAEQALARKYGLLYRLFAGFQKFRRLPRNFIEIQPVGVQQQG
jgi:PPOX class probable F420-dependent enzyme